MLRQHADPERYLAIAAGMTVPRAGCRAPGAPSEGSLGLTTTDVTVAPGGDAVIDVSARGVGDVTYRIEHIPDWQVTHGDFDPEPTVVRESCPPELVRDPPVGVTTGTLTVAVAEDAGAGEYELPVEAHAASSEEAVVSTATVTVEP